MYISGEELPFKEYSGENHARMSGAGMERNGADESVRRAMTGSRITSMPRYLSLISDNVPILKRRAKAGVPDQPFGHLSTFRNRPVAAFVPSAETLFFYESWL